jgi:acyl carrier protein
MSEEITQQIFTIVSQVMNVPLEVINLDSSPDTIDTWDSLKQMNLILALEDEFGVQFNDQQILEMQNVNLILIILGEILPSV